MRSEEVLRREAEYDAVREALGTYDVTLVVAQPCPKALPEAGVPASSAGPVDSLTSSTRVGGGPWGDATRGPTST